MSYIELTPIVMFKANFVKGYAMSAMIASVLSLLLILTTAVELSDISAMYWISIGVSIISWVLLGWTSLIAYKLISKFELDEDICVKLGWRMLIILGVFVVYLFFGFSLGIILAVYLFYSTKTIRENVEDWAREHSFDHFLNDSNHPSSH